MSCRDHKTSPCIIWHAAGRVFDPRIRQHSLEIGHFYDLSLPTADSSRAVVSYWQKDVHLVLVNHLGSLPRNSVVRLIDHLNMIIVVIWDVNQQIKYFCGLFVPIFRPKNFMCVSGFPTLHVPRFLPRP